MTSSQGAFVTSVNEIPRNCWYTDKKGKTVTAEVHGVFPLQNMLRFPRVLDRLDIMWSVTAVLNSGSAVHFTPRDFLCCLRSLFNTAFLLLIQLSIHLIFTCFNKCCYDVFRGWDLFHMFMKDCVVFSYILNNAWVWWWSVRRPKLLTSEIAVLCLTVYWINIFRVHCFCQTIAYCRHVYSACGTPLCCRHGAASTVFQRCLVVIVFVWLLFHTMTNWHVMGPSLNPWCSACYFVTVITLRFDS